MRQNFFQFYQTSLKNFFEAMVNLLIFFPYFFSVTTLLKTLFSPWKNLIAKKTIVGFSFNEYLNRVSFNLISRLIGFFIRFSLLSFYFIWQILFLMTLPFISLAYLLLIPLLFTENLFEKTEEEKKTILKNKFISSHLLKGENREEVEKWFELYYQKRFHKTKWWKVSNLFSYPPLARDWAVGYTPALNEFCLELSSSSYQTRMRNIINREKEIDQMDRALVKSEGANVIVVGEEGVGKHTVVDALAKKIYQGSTNSLLAYKRVLKINMEKILARTTDKKQREEFLEELFQEAAEAANIILFIDDFEKYVEFFPSIIKFAQNPRLQFIGITTPFAYQRIIFPQEKIARWFTKIDVYEVTKEEAEKILLDVALIFENRYQVIVPYETIKNAIDKSEFYLTYIPFPEKAIDLLDAACVFSKEKKAPVVTPDIIDTILTEKTHTPTTLTTDLKQKLIELETLLKEEIIAQDEAITKLTAALRQSFILIGKRKKPLASFLFLGPTGVGKTATARAIANVFFANQTVGTIHKLSLQKYLIRFDMSEYQLKDDIPKLIELMAATIREHPYGVLLLDEIEKANHDLINIFLTVLDEGYFTDGLGKRVDYKNLVIIATSNAGSDFLYQQTDSTDLTDFNRLFFDYLIEKRLFTPEFLNRFDGIVTYQHLSPQAMVAIAKKMLDKIIKDIFQLHKVTLRVSEVYLTALVEKNYDPKFGARHLERLLRDEVEDKVAKMILGNKVTEGDIINL